MKNKGGIGSAGDAPTLAAQMHRGRRSAVFYQSYSAVGADCVANHAEQLRRHTAAANPVAPTVEILRPAIIQPASARAVNCSCSSLQGLVSP